MAKYKVGDKLYNCYTEDSPPVVSVFYILEVINNKYIYDIYRKGRKVHSRFEYPIYLLDTERWTRYYTKLDEVLE